MRGLHGTSDLPLAILTVAHGHDVAVLSWLKATDGQVAGSMGLEHNPCL